MTKLNLNELLQYLREILDCNAFELHCKKDSDKAASQNFLIPYMMNDALECYLLLTDGRMTGTYITDLKESLSVELVNFSSDSADVSHPEDSALIFRQGTQNVFTLWFKDAFRVLNCYQYHPIGHFWVKGSEHWRRLAYIIGTLYDKYEYMGEKICSEKELALLPLMEFGPFRMYSPIHESLDSYYPETREGLLCMRDLALSAKDRPFLLMLKIYECFPYSFVKKWICKALNHPNRQKLYALINKKITEASSCYPKRMYDPALHDEIAASRIQVSNFLRNAGFSGTYPLFQKDNIQIHAMEEHPFTILEAGDFSFRIQFMVSEASVNSAALHIGFFKKRGNRSRIASDLNSLL